MQGQRNNDDATVAESSTPVPSRAGNFLQSARRTTKAVGNAAQENADMLGTFYSNTIVSKFLSRIHHESADYVLIGPTSFFGGRVKFGGVTLNEMTTRCFIYCTTAALVAWSWNILTTKDGLPSMILVAATSTILFEPFCSKVKDFKKAHPLAFSVIWGGSWAGICSAHHVLFSHSFRITSNILRFPGESPAALVFLGTALAMSYVIMMPTERLQSYIQAMFATKEEAKTTTTAAQQVGVATTAATAGEVATTTTTIAEQLPDDTFPLSTVALNQTTPVRNSSNTVQSACCVTPKLQSACCVTPKQTPAGPPSFDVQCSRSQQSQPLMCAFECRVIDSVQPYLSQFQPFWNKIFSEASEEVKATDAAASMGR